jgi:hypothetical protein
MAVDTAQKRYSMIAFGDDNQMLFETDSSVDLDDRQHLLGCYSGIAFQLLGKATGTLFSVQGPGVYPKSPYASFAGKVAAAGGLSIPIAAYHYNHHMN